MTDNDRLALALGLIAQLDQVLWDLELSDPDLKPGEDE